MLVLSRRLNEKVLFPNFQASVQVLAIKGNTVRLGIQAPPEVTILRGEIPDRQAEWATPVDIAATPDARPDEGQLSQLVRKRLKIASLGLELLRGQVEAGRAEDALAIVEGLTQELHQLQRRVAEEAGKTALRSAGKGPKGLFWSAGH
ncbi:MAG TPA: carbon storage regulator [Gemmataceae bacterium]|nr:carbon storage regulator [Gemmataceae bacterium]